MNTLLMMILLFMVVVAINSAAVYSQKRYKFYTHIFGRYDWQAHVVLLSFIWFAFLFALIFIHLPIKPLPQELRPLGVVITTRA